MSPGTHVLLHRPLTASASTVPLYSRDLLDAHHDEEEEEDPHRPNTNHSGHPNQNNNPNNLPPLHPSSHFNHHNPHEDRLNYMVPGDPVDPPPHQHPHPHQQQHPHLHPQHHPHMSVLPSSAMSASSPPSATLKRNVRPGASHQQPPQQQHPPHQTSHQSHPSDLPPGMNAPPPGLAMASHLPHLQETFTSLPPPPSHHASTTAGPLHPPPPPATASSAPTATTGAGRGKRKAAASSSGAAPPHSIDPSLSSATAEPGRDQAGGTTASPRPLKKSRTNTPWSPAEEQRLKAMRDAGSSWSDIAKTFPTRTEGSVKKHWYKDMHYAEFAEDESAALLAAIKEYEANKWKVIGQKVGKPAKACEQYAKEHFGGKS